MRAYEAVIIYKPELDGEALQASFKGAVDIIKKYQGEVEDVAEWGRKALAYTIAKKKEGTFYLVKFKSSPENVGKIEREFVLNEDILRSMISARKVAKEA